MQEQEGVFYCLVRDGSLRQAYEMDRLLNEQRLYRAYQQTGLSWWEGRVDTGVSVSESLCVIFGSDAGTQQALSREVFFSLVHPDDRAAVAESLEEMNFHVR